MEMTMAGLQLLFLSCLTAGAAPPAPATGVDIRSDDGTVLIAADQIRSYDWPTHTMTLAPKVRGQLADRLLKSRRLASGVPFAVTVGGKVIYRGTFTSLLS